jgi:hypothetical protein
MIRFQNFGVGIEDSGRLYGNIWDKGARQCMGRMGTWSCNLMVLNFDSTSVSGKQLTVITRQLAGWAVELIWKR